MSGLWTIDDEPEDDEEWCSVCGKPADLCDCFAVLRATNLNEPGDPANALDVVDILDVLEGNNDES